MEDEIMKALERNKGKGQEVDLATLISGINISNNIEPTIKPRYTMFNDSSKFGSVQSKDNYVAYTKNGNTLFVMKNKQKLIENFFDYNIVKIEISIESEKFLALVFENGSAKIFEIKNNALVNFWECEKDVISIKCGHGDFFILKKSGHLYSITKLFCEYMGRIKEESIVKSLTSKPEPKMVIVADKFMYTKNNHLLTLSGEDTRIQGEDFAHSDDELIAVETKVKRKFLYLIGKDLVLLNELPFNFDENCIIKIVNDVAAIAFENRIFVLKIKNSKFKQISEKKFDGKIVDFAMTLDEDVIEVFVLLSKAEDPGYDLVDLIVGKISEKIETDRHEAMLREKKRFEILLEKICDQLNKNLKIIVEDCLKNEIKSILEKEVTRAVDKKLQIKFDTFLKSNETTIQNSLKHLFFKSLVPAVEAGMSEMRVQMVDAVSKNKGEEKVCEKVKVPETKSVKLFNLIKRNEIQKGVELVIDSNEEVFYDFSRTFKPEYLRFVESSVVFELFRKTILYCACDKSEETLEFLEKIVEYVVKTPVLLDVFVMKINEGLILKMPTVVLITIYDAVVEEAGIANKPDYISFMELVFTSVNVQNFSADDSKDFLRSIELTNSMLEKSSYCGKVLKTCMEIQKRYLRKLSENLDGI